MSYSETLKDKKYNPISSKEEFELAIRIKAGDKKAMNRLVCANLRFVVLVAIRYAASGIPLQDLIQEGNLGVIEAAKRFDEKKNFKFISYAVWWIRHHILNLIHDTSRVVRVPPAAAYLSVRISRAIEKLQQRYGRDPTNQEISLELHTTERWVEVLMGTNETTSLNIPVMKNSEAIDFLEDKTNGEENYDYLLREVEKLRPIERGVIKEYFLSGHNTCLDDIGVKKGISRERVRQIKEMALCNMRKRIVREEALA